MFLDGGSPHVLRQGSVRLLDGVTVASNLEGCVQASLGALRAKGQSGRRKWHGLREEPESVWQGWHVGSANTVRG